MDQKIGTAIFVLAVIHTFFVSRFQALAGRFKPGTVGENLFHFLGEIEAVFGLWSGAMIAYLIVSRGFDRAVAHVEALNFTEPAFVFVIMAMAATRPVIRFAERAIIFLSRLIPAPPKTAFFIATLVLGPLLGSFITEPAAMTVTAMVLLEGLYKPGLSSRFKYATLGLLFVNVSIGGTLTHFAAPPVLMVAGKWGWGISHMLTTFGYKAALAVLLSTLVTARVFRRELRGEVRLRSGGRSPAWVSAVHLAFLAAAVATSHHIVFFLGIFLFFLGFASVTREYQSELKLREALLVGFFLAGLVVLGSFQSWWLQPLLAGLGSMPLYFGAAGLTAITDNAALTYLGSLVPDLSEQAKYFLVAGAVAGGGLTVIANAPNPAGYGILKECFGDEGIHPLRLFAAALGPTVVALLAFLLLP